MSDTKTEKKKAVTVFVDTFARGEPKSIDADRSVLPHGVIVEVVTPTDPAENAVARANLHEELLGLGLDLQGSKLGRRVL